MRWAITEPLRLYALRKSLLRMGKLNLPITSFMGCNPDSIKTVAVWPHLIHGSFLMLTFDGAWRFDSPGPIADGVSNAFFDLIGRIAKPDNRKEILEHFKDYFASAAGSSSSYSSSTSWAESDLLGYMQQAAANGPLFVEAFYDACQSLANGNPPTAVPDLNRINRILSETQSGYQIQPPNLLSTNVQTQITVPPHVPSLDEQAQAMIQKSLNDSEQMLSEGRNRPAVQEILWLLETVSTAFQGLETEAGTVQGKYFNKIIANLQKHNRGTALDQILSWVITLHGYLSSPTGGGIRHGTDLRAGVATQPDEARLFCNLIRSYITFLLSEHERLSR